MNVYDCHLPSSAESCIFHDPTLESGLLTLTYCVSIVMPPLCTWVIDLGDILINTGTFTLKSFLSFLLIL